MDNVIYDATIVGSGFASDGETPTKVILTEETNGYALWFTSAEEYVMREFILWKWSRNAAIEKAVAMAQKEKAIYEASKRRAA